MNRGINQSGRGGPVKADVCVIYNARAGSGRAAERLRRLRRVLGPRAEFRATAGRGHGEELAREAAEAGFPVVAAAGGDGTVHEVANGLLRSGRPDTTLAVVPIGSANDYSHSLGLGPDWWLRADSSIGPAAVDVGVVRDRTGRETYFVNNIGIGLTGVVALEAERVALRGLARYMIGLMRTLCFRYHHPLMAVTLDDQTRREPTLALTLGIGKREGNFVLVPRAELDDGLFDYVHAGALTRRTLLRLLPAGVAGRLPDDYPGLRLGRCRRASLESEAALVAHTDGEFFCRPEQDVRALEVELLPGRLRVLRRR
jgi:diacylglycerol kinase family enzyme